MFTANVTSARTAHVGQHRARRAVPGLHVSRGGMRRAFPSIGGLVAAAAVFSAAVWAAPAGYASSLNPDYTVVAATGSGFRPPAFISNARPAPILEKLTLEGSVDVAVSPDGKTAYVLDGKGQLVPVSLPAGTQGTPIAIGGGASLVRVSPTGQLAWVVQYNNFHLTIHSVDLQTGRVSAGFSLHANGVNLDAITDLTFSPDGRFAYVTDLFAGLAKVEVSNKTVLTTVPTEQNLGPDAEVVVLSADGRRAYVSNFNTIAVVDTARMSVLVTIKDGGYLAMSPDGRTLWVLRESNSKNPYLLDTVNLATDTVTPFMKLSSALTESQIRGFAITPDGNSVYISDSPTNSNQLDVHVVDVKARKLAAVVVRDGVGGAGRLAITPDQAPVAAVTTSSVGCTFTFDASASTVRYGRISRYAWTFGDGKTAVTTSPTVAHTYAISGSLTATVVETDSAGTSTQQVSDGHTVLLNGGPSARATVAVEVVGCAAPQSTSSATPPVTTSPVTPDGSSIQIPAGNVAVARSESSAVAPVAWWTAAGFALLILLAGGLTLIARRR
jgi:DNA-binding beta-propeller fold protein YncE